MIENQLAQATDNLRTRLRKLYQWVNELPQTQQQAEWLAQTFAELHTSLEVLEIAQEQLEYRFWQQTAELQRVSEQLQTEVRKPQAVGEALGQQEENYCTSFEPATPRIALVTLSGKFIWVNQEFGQFLGYTESELLGRTFQEIAHPEDLELSIEYRRRMLAGEIPTYSFPQRYLGKDGELRFYLTLSLVRDAEGKPEYFLEMIEETNNSYRQTRQNKPTEEQLQISLQEKVVLLEEIHHRVKNNLQIISSLLYLQANRSNAPQVRAILQESRNRIESMALVHESLYYSGELTKVNFTEYLHNLATNLLNIYDVKPSNVALKISAPKDISLHLDKAIPCGLIINELISNTLRHSFVACEKGEIFVKLERSLDSQIILRVGNRGKNLPIDLDLQNTQSMGLRLVITLVKQIKGTIEVEQNEEVVFTIKFIV